MEIYITSDTHFGHSNIINLSSRPFADIAAMNEGLIEAWNARVKPCDVVYHLGDFAFRPAAQFVSKLHGSICLVRGNHDKDKIIKDAGFAWVKDVYTLKAGNARFWLSHYPHRAWPQSHYGAYHLHGHCHGNLPRFGRSMDVGVDVDARYKPWHVDEIVQVLQNASFTNHHPPKM